MKKGGYQIIDLSAYKFTNGESQIIKNIYNIIKNTKKVFLISGLTVDGTEYHDMFAVFMDYETFFCGLAQYEGNNICFVVRNDGSVGVNIATSDTSELSWVPYSLDISEFKNTAYGGRVWSDGVNVYYSYNYSEDKQDNFIFINGQWVEHNLNINIRNGAYVWHDLEGKTYFNYSGYGSYEFINGEWVTKNWEGLTDFNGENTWNDGVNVYYSAGSKHYKLENGVWVEVTFTQRFYGTGVFNIDGKTYMSVQGAVTTVRYMYEFSNGEFNRVYFTSEDSDDVKIRVGKNVWKDYKGVYYYSYTGTDQYIINGTNLVKKDWGENYPEIGTDIFTADNKIYFMNFEKQLILK